MFLVYWVLFEAFDLLRTSRRIKGEGLAWVAPLNAVGFLGLSYVAWSAKAPDQLFPLGRIVLVEPLRKDPLQNRDRKKRPGDRDQREPFGVVVGGGHENPSRGGWPGPNPGGELTGMLIVGG